MSKKLNNVGNSKNIKHKLVYLLIKLVDTINWIVSDWQ